MQVKPGIRVPAAYSLITYSFGYSHKKGPLFSSPVLKN